MPALFLGHEWNGREGLFGEEYSVNSTSFEEDGQCSTVAKKKQPSPWKEWHSLGSSHGQELEKGTWN